MTNTITITEINDKVKQDVTDILSAGEATIVFTKVDGTVRQMKVTISPDLTPTVTIHEGVEKNKRPSNPDIRTVYDLEANAWKSFRWNNLLSVIVGDKK